MVKKLKEEDNQEYKAKVPVLEGQDIQLQDKEGVIKDYSVDKIDEKGVHLIEWDVIKNEAMRVIIIPPEDYECTFGVTVS